MAPMITLMALIFAACSGSNSGYSSGSYDPGSYAAAPAGDVNAGAAAPVQAGNDSLGGAVQSVVHDEKQEARIHKAQKTEPLLAQAGFKSMAIDTPAKHKVIEGLAPLSFNRLGHHGKIHYWFADPYYCNCVFVGNQLAYYTYKQMKKENKKYKVDEADLIDQENNIDVPMDSQWDPVSAFGMP
jgi:hypothetical protein